MRVFLLALLVFSVVTTVHARLGETPQEFQERYGAPTKTLPDGRILYSKAGLLISASFYEGHAETLQFQKADHDASGAAPDLSDHEIDLLLTANGGGHAWKQDPKATVGKSWLLDSGEAVASYIASKHSLFFATRGYIDRFNAKKADEDAKLKGF